MKQRFKILFTAVAVLLMGTLYAQVTSEAGVVAETATAAAPKVTTEEISAFEFLMKGGIFLIPIGILLFYTLVVMVEKFRYIKRVTKFDPSIMNSVESGKRAGNFSSTLSALERDTTAYGSVIKQGVETVKARPGKTSEIESNMDKMANIEIGKMEKNINHLGLIAGIAPTLGFIGTISGVIKIFYSISITENVSIGNISGGLYEKMISSGSGLVVGIIAFAGYHLLNGMIDKYALNIQKLNLEFVNLINSPEDGNKA